MKEPGSKDALESLRQQMKGENVDAVIVPTEDPHNSEIPPNAFKRREFITGFTGSAGTAVVTHDRALLWTDGRYFAEAERQLGVHWALMRAGEPDVPEVKEWLADNLGKGATVGIDPRVHTSKAAGELRERLEGAKVQLRFLDRNLVDDVWGDLQPPLPRTELWVHPERWAGESVSSKLARMREEMANEGADLLVASALDEVCWLFNIRARDVENTPLVLAYATLGESSAYLYTDTGRVPESVREHLRGSGVEVREYDDVVKDVEQAAADGCKVWADPGIVNAVVTDAVERGGKRRAGKKRKKRDDGDGEGLLAKRSPVVMAKARKNAAELEGMREAHLREGAVMAQFWAWLEGEVAAGREHTEEGAANKLEELRAQQEGYIEPSFPSILGEGPNAAIIHHRASNDRTIGKESMVLLDAGGQYDCGTTDATRTRHMGQPQEHHKECYTRVLKGHMAVDQAVFPENTAGHQLDSHARYELWQHGLDYRHGTGHGVGAALCVHEGPQSISQRSTAQDPLCEGMIVSNEPGYYEDGSFGIRIENLVTVREASTAFNFAGKRFLAFSPLTFIPLQHRLLARHLLSDADLSWIDRYHQQVWDTISCRLPKDSPALAWLKSNTQPLSSSA